MAGNKAVMLWLVNTISIILLAILMLTGLANWLALPHGSPGGAGFLAGLRHFLREIHEWTAVLFVAVICVHVAMHWSYVKSNLRKTGLLK